MTNILEQIIKNKKETLSLIKKNNSLDSLEKKIKSLNFFNNFKEAIQNNKGISLISEIKKVWMDKFHELVLKFAKQIRDRKPIEGDK